MLIKVLGFAIIMGFSWAVYVIFKDKKKRKKLENDYIELKSKLTTNVNFYFVNKFLEDGGFVRCSEHIDVSSSNTAPPFHKVYKTLINSEYKDGKLSTEKIFHITDGVSKIVEKNLYEYKENQKHIKSYDYDFDERSYLREEHKFIYDLSTRIEKGSIEVYSNEGESINENLIERKYDEKNILEEVVIIKSRGSESQKNVTEYDKGLIMQEIHFPYVEKMSTFDSNPSSIISYHHFKNGKLIKKEIENATSTIFLAHITHDTNFSSVIEMIQQYCKLSYIDQRYLELIPELIEFGKSKTTIMVIRKDHPNEYEINATIENIVVS